MRSINLLPPEAHVKEQARERVARLLLFGLVYVGILWWSRFCGRQGSTRLSSSRLAQQDSNRLLEVQIADFQGIEGLVTEYDANVALMEAALADDLSWGRILNDLGRILPDSVWLQSFRVR